MFHVEHSCLCNYQSVGFRSSCLCNSCRCNL